MKINQTTVIELCEKKELDEVKDQEYFYPTYHDGFITINKKTNDNIETILVSNNAIVIYK